MITSKQDFLKNKSFGNNFQKVLPRFPIINPNDIFNFSNKTQKVLPRFSTKSKNSIIVSTNTVYKDTTVIFPSWSGWELYNVPPAYNETFYPPWNNWNLFSSQV